jgi:hypothetical protein
VPHAEVQESGAFPPLPTPVRARRRRVRVTSRRQPARIAEFGLYRSRP